MKKLLLVCVIALGISAVGHAQGRGMNMKPEERAAQMKTQLALNDDQTAKITAIYAAQTKSMDSLRNAGGDFSAMRPMMTATNAKIKAVLTADQAKKWDDMMAQQRARMGGGQGGGGTPPPSRK